MFPPLPKLDLEISALSFKIRNDDGLTKDWDVDFEYVSVPLDPIPHRLAAKYSESNTLHELG